MTCAFELLLNDSEVAAIEPTATGLVVRLSAAAVRRHGAEGGRTEGHMTGVRLLLDGAALPGPTDASDACWIGRIREGHWITAGQRMGTLPATVAVPGPGRLCLTFHQGDVFEALGSVLTIRWPEVDTFRESLAC